MTISEFRLASETTEWPTTQGTIVKSVVHGGGKRARHQLLYVYQVDGRQYSGHRATLRDGLIKYRTSDRAQLYHEGREVAVYYSPTQPGSSVLETGIHWPGVWFHIFAALVTTGIGGGGLYLTFRA